MNRRVLLAAAALGLPASVAAKLWISGQAEDAPAAPSSPAPPSLAVGPDGPHGGTEGATGVRTSRLQGVPDREISVLFLGNSYTYVNDLPGTILAVAEADPGARTRISVQSVTRGAGRLAERVVDPALSAALAAHRWDCVVAQEQSEWACVDDWAERSLAAAARLRPMLASAGVRAAAVFETWARKPWCPDYANLPYLGSYDRMWASIATRSPELAAQLGGVVVPVGHFWDAALRQLPDIELYSNDGSHPAPPGTLLAALVFYRFLTERSPAGIVCTPPGVRRPQAESLAALAAR